MMERAEVAVVGSGPAGLCAAIAAAEAGARVVLLDENDRPGGQLIKQIHRFFGTADHHAGERGYEIGRNLLSQVRHLGVDVRLSTTVWGTFPGPLLACATDDGRSYHLTADRVILATGASELAIAFPGWTLPGVMGAGAAQTLINLHRVRPGSRALVIGSGNVGLIVSYQLIQAGVEVAAVVEAAPEVGGWDVHAARLRRTGVPIVTSHTVVEAFGDQHVTSARIAQTDDSWRAIPGTERDIDVDLICLAVGLRPQTQLAGMLELEMADDPRRGGRVPVRDQAMRSSHEHVYVAGDLGMISEASIAMEEGRIAGRAAAQSVSHGDAAETDRLITEARARIAIIDIDVKTMPRSDAETRRVSLPARRPSAPGPHPIIECHQHIPCNPCEAACPHGLITVGDDPTNLPTVEPEGCTGCLQCVRACPGMAIFIVEPLPESNEALISMPWEFLPLPEPGDAGQGLDHHGQPVCPARVARVSPARPGGTPVLTVAVPLQHSHQVRGFRQPA